MFKYLERPTICHDITPTVLGNDEHGRPFCVVLKVERDIVGLGERIQVAQGNSVEILGLEAPEADDHGYGCDWTPSLCVVVEEVGWKRRFPTTNAYPTVQWSIP